MRDRLIDGLIQGDRLAWGGVALLWVLAAVVVLVHRPGGSQGRTAAWTWLLLAVATATSLAGLPLSSAIAVPRVRWATVEAPDLLATDPRGGPAAEGWRRLRGPTVLVDGPDIGVPTVDAAGRWVLLGILSGKPVEGLPAAEPAPMRPGAPRLCLTAGDECRPWPVGWPDPARPVPLGELGWFHPGPGGAAHVDESFAYDTESGYYLRTFERPSGVGPGAPFLELVGRLGGAVSREPGVLFVLRRVAAGRLKAVRIVHAPGPGGGFTVQRAEVSLTTGPRAFGWFVRPLLALISVSLPLGVVALLLAPVLHRRLRRARPGSPPYRRPDPEETPTRREAAAWIAPYLEAVAVLLAGLAAAAPAAVALAALWGSR